MSSGGDALNANPTIINISDLPTRRAGHHHIGSEAANGTSAGGAASLFPWLTTATPAFPLAPDPFDDDIDDAVATAAHSRASSSEDEDRDGGDNAREDIDEQEIFGKDKKESTKKREKRGEKILLNKKEGNEK
jgi:hypothetical protein